MKLDFVYPIIGFFTLFLNTILTMHMLKKRRSKSKDEAQICRDVITFNLARGKRAEAVTTAAVPCDDTVFLQE